MATSNESLKRPIDKVPTGIEGLDDILSGGLPRDRTTLVVGGPGTGKTLLGLEFLYRGAIAGEPGIFVTFEESAEAVRRNSAAMGWNFEAEEAAGRLLVTHVAMPPDLLLSGEFEIGGLLAILAGHTRTLGARRIVVDALDILLRIFPDAFRRENQLYALHDWLLSQGLTAVLTAKRARSGENGADPSQVLDYLADCVVLLDQRVDGQISTRRLRVLKYRGSNFLSNEYPCVISEDGLVLMPVSSMELQHRALGSPTPTGINRLDDLLGGGFRAGASILLSGSSGTGKTTVACTFASAASQRGERVLYISFEESTESLLGAMTSVGIDLAPAVATGRLRILTAMPESLGVENHLLRIFRALDDFLPDHIVIDAVSAVRRMGTERAAFDFLARVINRCRASGITCIMINQIDPSDSLERIGGFAITSVLDVLIRMEQTWRPWTHERRLLIIKSRGGRHSHVPHVFAITDQGIDVGAAVTGRASGGQEEG